MITEERIALIIVHSRRGLCHHILESYWHFQHISDEVLSYFLQVIEELMIDILCLIQDDIYSVEQIIAHRCPNGEIIQKVFALLEALWRSRSADTSL